MIYLALMRTEKDFRLVMLNQMPLVDIHQNKIAEESRIPSLTNVWDLFDKEEKKFIMVRYASNKESIL